MFAALLQNNNNAQPLRTGFKADPRASSGRSRPVDATVDVGGEQHGQSFFNIADIAAAAALFPEIAHEDPATRATRRVRWISEALPFIKATREKREAAAFLVGAQLANAAAEERYAAQTQLKIEQIVEIIDAVRREAVSATPAVPAVPLPRSCVEHQRGDRSHDGSGLGLFIGGLVIGGLLVGHALRKRAPSGARRTQR